MSQPKVVALVAAEAPPRVRKSVYPAPYAARMDGREKRPLGDLFGLVNFGVAPIAQHEVTAHGAHCTNTKCVMYYANEGASAALQFARDYMAYMRSAYKIEPVFDATAVRALMTDVTAGE